jgi:hypothetical protein
MHKAPSFGREAHQLPSEGEFDDSPQIAPVCRTNGTY